jgi:uncharacterized membrane protein YuzA (DUF378 family)
MVGSFNQSLISIFKPLMFNIITDMLGLKSDGQDLHLSF